MFKGITGIVTVIALASGIGAWSVHRNGGSKAGIGTNPGDVHHRNGLISLKPAVGNSLVAFSSGCFWGAEQAYRKLPGIVATAVGYTGGSSRFPSYELAHKTGHLETVLIEFNPKRTPLEVLLKVFWTLPRSKNPDEPSSQKSSYQATIWTYDSQELGLAERSRVVMEKTLRSKLAVQIKSAEPFYLAEDYHQQYDEKAGKELCPATP
jgi:peptide-methionine (S)-S-oxide reductase